MVANLFDVLLDLNLKYFIENLCTDIHKDIGLRFSLCSLGIQAIVAS